MSFPIAIKLLRQRREEITKQLIHCAHVPEVIWKGRKKIESRNKEYAKIMEVYRLVNREIEILEQL